MDERNQFFKPKFRGPLQEVNLPDFPDDDNTVTTTVTKSRRVSFGTNVVKEFIVGSALSEQFVAQYEKDFSSSDSSNANSSHSAVESGILDPNPFCPPEPHKLHPAISRPGDPVESHAKRPKFSSTICFSADSPTEDMEFTEGCLNLAKSILDKKNKEMTLIIQAKPKEKIEDKVSKDDETKHFDGSEFDMSMTKCFRTKDSKREEKRFAEEKSRIFSGFDDDSDGSLDSDTKENQMPLDMIMHHLDKDNTDFEKSLFCQDKSLTGMLIRNHLGKDSTDIEKSLFCQSKSLTAMLDPCNASNDSEQLNLNESMDISGDFQRGMFKQPTPKKDGNVSRINTSIFRSEVMPQKDDSIGSAFGAKEEDSLLEMIGTGVQVDMETTKNSDVLEFGLPARERTQEEMLKDANTEARIAVEMEQSRLGLKTPGKSQNSISNPTEGCIDLTMNLTKGNMSLDDRTKTIGFPKQEKKVERSMLEDMHVASRERSIAELQRTFQVVKESSIHAEVSNVEGESRKLQEDVAERHNMEEEMVSVNRTYTMIQKRVSSFSREVSFGQLTQTFSILEEDNSKQRGERLRKELERQTEGEVLDREKSIHQREIPTDEGIEQNDMEMTVNVREILGRSRMSEMAAVSPRPQRDEFLQSEETKKDENDAEVTGIAKESFEDGEEDVPQVVEEAEMGEENEKEVVAESQEDEKEIEMTENLADILRDKGTSETVKESLSEVESNVVGEVETSPKVQNLSGMEMTTNVRGILRKNEEIPEMITEASNPQESSIEEPSTPRHSVGYKESLEVMSPLTQNMTANPEEVLKGDEEVVPESDRRSFCEMELTQNLGGAVRNKEEVPEIVTDLPQHQEENVAEVSSDAREDVAGLTELCDVNEMEITSKSVTEDKTIPEVNDELFKEQETQLSQKDKEKMDVAEVEKVNATKELSEIPKTTEEEKMEECKQKEVELQKNNNCRNVLKIDTEDADMEMDEEDESDNPTDELLQEEDLPLADAKVIHSLREQSKEDGCIWEVGDLRYLKKKSTASWSFNFKLLESSTKVRFILKVSDKDDFDVNGSVIKSSDIHLEEKKLRLPQYTQTLDFGYEKQKKYFTEERKRVETVRFVPYFLDQMNLFALKLNSYLSQVYAILKKYPGSNLKDSTLSFRLFSYPVFFSSNVYIDLRDLFRISKSSISFETDLGSFDESKLREIFHDCLKRENCLCEFIIAATKYIIDLEQEMGCRTKRSHIKLLPVDLR